MTCEQAAILANNPKFVHIVMRGGVVVEVFYDKALALKRQLDLIEMLKPRVEAEKRPFPVGLLTMEMEDWRV